MNSKRYPEEFKIEAVKQVTEKGHSVADVANRLGTTTHSLYAWLKRYGPDSSQYQAQSEESAEIRRLKKELQRVAYSGDCDLGFPPCVSIVVRFAPAHAILPASHRDTKTR